VQVKTDRPEELKASQEKALDLKREVEDRYDLSILVRVAPNPNPKL
jgi:hypothetical protein